MTSGTTGSAVLTFLGQEARGLGRAFWGVFWKVTLAVAVLVVVSSLVGSRNSAGGSVQDASLLTEIVAYVAVGVYFGAIVGAATGLFTALWRLFGSSLLLVLLLTPILVLAVLWLFNGPITSSAIHFLDNVVASAQREGFQHTAQASEGMRMSCGGGAIAILLVVLLSPFLVADIGFILTDTSVLWAFLKFAGTMALTFAVATAVAVLFACPVLMLALIRRGRRRFGELPSA